mmetsp:Transcript_58378/g.126271  ORF Transcript_58378/g.126271 Transcript_58378/m.126271 type:complete len:572 (+) Transcript_58378:53-1768(+)
MEEPAADVPDGEDVGSSLGETVEYIVRNFLEPKHNRSLHQALSKRWNRLHSFSAATKLMEHYGVHLSSEEIERIAAMDEAHQIDALVTKMPQQSNEQFETFFLQLQLIVSTASRVRQALQEGRSDLVEAALNDANSTGIFSNILRLSIVQAGSEVTSMRGQFEAWVKDTDVKMASLMRGQQDALVAQKKLAAAEAQLSQYTVSHKEKAKKVLVTLTAGSASALTSTCFKGWQTLVKQLKAENEIRKEYEDRILEAEKRLITFKAERLKNVRGVMEKKAAQGEGLLLAEVIKIWREDIEYRKDVAENAQKVKELESKLQGIRASQAETTKKVMGRLNADNDSSLVSMAFKAWINFHQEYLKDRELEDRVKASEQQVAAFLKSHTEGAKKVLQGLSSGSEAGIIKTAWDCWKQGLEEAKREAELAEILEGANSKCGAFGERNRKNARNVMDRARQHLVEMLLQQVWNAWRRDARMERAMRSYHVKIEAKRQQLMGVQQMFRTFAVQLETGLKENADTSSDLRDIRDQPPRPRKQSLFKSDATVPLPEIEPGGKAFTAGANPRTAAGPYPGAPG